MIGITLGDPGGIGPEVVLKALQHYSGTLPVTLYGPKSVLEYLPASYHTLVATTPWVDSSGGYKIGHSTAENGLISYQSLLAAHQDAIAGKINAIVTAPINKSSLSLAGIAGFDHTTILKHLNALSSVRMAFHSPTLNVLLHSVHIPLKEVFKTLTAPELQITFGHATNMMRLLKRSSPRIALAGLNPHAGEGGLMGDEERMCLDHVVSDWNASHIQKIEGPFPPDTIFRRAHLGEFDLVIALYHDQGLIPIKLIHFDDAVNWTLGLPYIRTSPDHGTAFDIAYQGLANPSSMIAAIALAQRIVL